MVFTKRLREGVCNGDITCSVRIWMRPRVSVGGRYRMEEGEIEVDLSHVYRWPKGEPSEFGLKLSEFHAANRERRHAFEVPARGAGIGALVAEHDAHSPAHADRDE